MKKVWTMHVYGIEAFSPFNMPLLYEIVRLTPDNSNPR